MRPGAVGGEEAVAVIRAEVQAQARNARGGARDLVDVERVTGVRDGVEEVDVGWCSTVVPDPAEERRDADAPGDPDLAVLAEVVVDVLGTGSSMARMPGVR